LSRPELPGSPFPSGPALRFLTGIHPLRYVVVHNDLIEPEDQQKWRRLREMPWAQLVGSYGPADLYRLTGQAGRGRGDKLFWWDFARARREVASQARAIGSAAGERGVEVLLTGRPLGRQPIGADWVQIAVPLRGRLFHSAPNAVSVVYHYRRPEGSRPEPIGRTGAPAPPVHLAEVSRRLPGA